MSRIAILWFGCLVVFAGARAFPQVATRGPIGTTRTIGGDGINPGSYDASNGARPGASDPDEQKIWAAAGQLKLDPDQRAQLDSALKAQKGERGDLEKALEQARTTLADALRSGQSSVESEIENLASANARIQEYHLKRWASLYALLTPDQQRQMLMMPTPLSQATAPAQSVEAQ
jgi:Spy/CpxP family protein refolding chaperone